MISPTGNNKVREDAAGSGKFLADRGWRKHYGTDFLFKTGIAIEDHDILAPVTGKLIRDLAAYNDNPSWRGLEIAQKHILIRLLYVKVDPDLIGKRVTKGQVIGKGQDIRKRYPDEKEMEPHVHTAIFVNPELFLD